MSVTPIAEKVSAMRAGSFAQPESPFDREQRQLASTQPTGVIAAGERLPDADLLDVHGEATSLLAQLDESLSMQQKNDLTFAVVSDPDYSTRTEPAEVLTALDGLGA